MIGAAVAAPKSLDFVAYWNKGDQRLYQVQYTKKSITESGVEKVKKTNYTVSLKVLDSTEKSYDVEWTSSNYDISDTEMSTGTMNELRKLGANIPVLYSVDEMGAFAELKNKAQIKELTTKAMDIAFKELPKDSATEQRIAAMKSMFLADGVLEALMLRDVQVFHSPYSGSYSLGKPQVYAIEWPNLWGTDPIPAQMTVKVVKFQPQKDLAELDISSKIDPKKAVKLIKAVFDQLGTEPEKGKMPNQLDITEHSKYVVELSTGWLKSLKYVKTAKFMGQTQIETYEFKRVE